MGPIAAKERVLEIDILRGFALFGVLLVNFSSPTLGGFTYGDGKGLDYWVYWTVDTIFQHKFILLFSLLFGLGFAIQMGRAQSRGANFSSIYLRRLVILLMIGLLHAFFVWKGDILHSYAILGVFLILFQTCSNKLLLAVAALSLAVGASNDSISNLLGLSQAPPMSGGIPATELYTNTPYAELVWIRMTGLAQVLTHLSSYVASMDVFGMFLLGLYVGRRRLLADIKGNMRLIRTVMWSGLAIGIIGRGWDFASRVGVILVPGGADGSSVLLHFLSSPTLAAFVKLYRDPALSLFYASTLAILLTNPRWRNHLRPLGSFGRTALTQYLMQSLIGVGLFYGSGLALYGKLGFTEGIGVVFLVFIIQVALSSWWLTRFQFGPMEWVWRSLTYATVQPILVGAADSFSRSDDVPLINTQSQEKRGRA
jgi:uncharacterized protein